MNFPQSQGSRRGRLARKVVDSASKRSRTLKRRFVLEDLEKRQLLAINVYNAAPVAAVEGTAFNGTVATFTDSLPATPANFTATIDWGDPAGDTTVGVVTGGPTFTLTGTHTFADEGVFPLKVTMTDSTDASTFTATGFNATVSDAPLSTITPLLTTAKEFSTQGVGFAVGSFTDGNTLAPPSDFTATINWGDGTTAAGVVVGAAGAFTVEAAIAHTYVLDEGAAPVLSMNVHDVGGSTATGSGVVPITEGDTLTGVPMTITPVEGNSFSGPVATFADSIPNLPSDFTATINWADGTITAGTITGGAGTFTVSGAHAYAEEGTVHPTVVLSDDAPGTATAAALSTANVQDAPLTATAVPLVNQVEGVAFTAPVATFTDGNPAAPIVDFTAAISWGDGTTSAGTITQPGGVGTAFSVSGSHIFAEQGIFPVQVLIQDEGGSSAAFTNNATIADAPLTATGTAVFGTEGAPLTHVQVATFTDADVFGTASDYLATINWGSGVTSAGDIAQDATGLFHVTGSHTYTEEGPAIPISVTIIDHSAGRTVADPTNSTATAATTADIVQSPLLPVAATITPVEGVAVSPTAIVATFTDQGGADGPAEYTASIDWGDGTTTAGTVLSSGVNFEVIPGGVGHTYADEGFFPLVVRITDSDLLDPPPTTAFATGLSIVADAPITATPGPAFVGVEGTLLTNVSVATFTDANPTAAVGDFIAFINWGDGTPNSPGVITQPGGVGTEFVVSGNHEYAEASTAGPYTITTTIKDVGLSQAQTTTAAAILDATLTGLTGIPITTTESPNTVPFDVATFIDNNEVAPNTDFTAMIDWGDGGPATLGTVTRIGGAAGQSFFKVSGTHAYTETGSFPIGVTVVDDDGSTVSNATLESAIVNEGPVAAQAFPVVATEGAAFANVLVASFTDPGGNDPASEYVASIDWGDGTAPTLGTVVATGLGYNVLGGHTYAEGGTYAVHVTIADGTLLGAPTVVVGSAAHVADAALTLGTSDLPIAATEGTAFSGPLLTFTDANPVAPIADFTATINWGDGSITFGTITQPSGVGTAFSVTGSHVYEEGTYPVSIHVHDDDGSNLDVTGNATVADATLTSTFVPFSPTVGNPFTGEVATFTDANPIGTVSDFTAAVEWGDGATSTGTVVEDAFKVFHVSGTHTYAVVGPETVTVIIQDVGGQNTTATGAITVKDAPLSVVGLGAIGRDIHSVEGSPFSGPVALFTSANPLATAADFTATINWGDGSAPTAGTVVANGNGFIVDGTHTYLEEGDYDVTVFIADIPPGTSTVTAFTNALVADAPPNNLTPLNFAVTEGKQFNLPIAAFSEIFGAEAPEPASDFKAFIDWGDGSPPTQGTLTDIIGGVQVSGIHTYKDAHVNGGDGTFNVTVTVIDDGGTFVRIPVIATVHDVPIVLTAHLNPASDSGQSHFDAITNIAQPNFYGTSEPFSVIHLFAHPLGGGLFPIGSGVANAAGVWSITSAHLGDGKYVITAGAVDKAGFTTASTQILPNATQGPLTIDTVAPKITNVVFDRLNGQFDIIFQDTLSGMSQRSVIDGANYLLFKANAKPPQFLITGLSTLIPLNPASAQEVIATVNNGHSLRGGMYTFVIRSASDDKVAGIQDVAGNALDGEFYGFFPTGNNIPGGDFVAIFDAIHHKIFPPVPPFSTATPNNPPGTLPPTTIIPVTVNPKTGKITSTKTVPVKQAVVKTTAHDLALAHVVVPKKKPVHH